MAKSDIGGVWRTIGGRRVFIKDGQSLEEAMKESGKFENKKEEKRITAEEVEEKKKAFMDYKEEHGYDEKAKELQKEYNRLQSKYNQQENQQKEVSSQNKETNKKDEYKVLEKESTTEEIIKNINIDNEDYKKMANEAINQENDMLQIREKDIDYIVENSKSMEKLEKQIDYFNEKGIDYDDEIYGELSNRIFSKITDELNEQGYSGRYIKNEYVYDQYETIQKEYKNMQDYFDKNDINYHVSRSTNAGELPSIYLETKDGDTFRIANHYNHQSDEYQITFNPKYTAKDYKNWNEVIIKDIEKNLGIKMRSLNEIKDYYISKGYSQETALKMAKEDIKERKKILK